MADTRQRLIRCFQAVFPKLNENEVARAAMTSVGAWDSVATVTLAAALEEEFGVQFEMDEIEKMKSFESCLELLSSHGCADGRGAPLR
ncbi:MAG TPA: acyl carrier protein [Candidatus Dormibacteraeota bacterium]|nr:acyl carrier protein [Candidatus Dormibacteraeota bacterium]